ncbi:MAG: SelB C-terminal domain-containing protein, partial [Anaerolineaceae bacterium]|nr:SelB C-terminal domain-containing protein [Anaerolineaceae bacterium]
PSRQDVGQPRLPIDRVFTMSGFGTVVTGTLNGGSLNVGDEVELQPGDLRGRIRGLQCYQQKVSEAWPGSRVAVNISGLTTADVARGHVLANPGQLKPTTLADVRFRYLPSVTRSLSHNAEVKFFSGTSEAVARVRLLEGDEMAPGDTAWLQLRIASELPLGINDRFILRWPSPAETIGGGVVLDPHPGRQWRRNQSRVLQRLRILSEGSPQERVTLAAQGRHPRTRKELQDRSGLIPTAFELALERALQAKSLTNLPDGRLLATQDRDELMRQQRDVLATWHRQFPLRSGMQREDLRSRLDIAPGLLGFLLDSDEAIEAQADIVSLRQHEVRFSPEQQRRIQVLQEKLKAQAFSPPSWSEASSRTGEELLLALVENGTLVRVTPEVFFSRDSWQKMVRATLDFIEQDGSVSASQLRDRFNTSRKYAIALLESLDEARITRREGDVRVRGAASLPTLLVEDQTRRDHQNHS